MTNPSEAAGTQRIVLPALLLSLALNANALADQRLHGPLLGLPESSPGTNALEWSLLTSTALPAQCVAPRETPGPKTPPPYPALAKAMNQEGSADFSFIVEADGSIAADGMNLLRSSNAALLDEAAAEYLHRHRFLPGTCNGAPIRMRHQYRVTFRLEDGLDCVPPMVLPDVPARPPYPPGARSRGEQGVVTLGFLVDTDGSVMSRGMFIYRDSGFRELDAAAVAFILGHRFKPGTCSGVPMTSGFRYDVKYALDERAP